MKRFRDVLSKPAQPPQKQERYTESEVQENANEQAMQEMQNALSNAVVEEAQTPAKAPVSIPAQSQSQQGFSYEQIFSQQPQINMQEYYNDPRTKRFEEVQGRFIESLKEDADTPFFERLANATINPEEVKKNRDNYLARREAYNSLIQAGSALANFAGASGAEANAFTLPATQNNSFDARTREELNRFDRDLDTARQMRYNAALADKRIKDDLNSTIYNLEKAQDEARYQREYQSQKMYRDAILRGQENAFKVIRAKAEDENRKAGLALRERELKHRQANDNANLSLRRANLALAREKENRESRRDTSAITLNFGDKGGRVVMHLPKDHERNFEDFVVNTSLSVDPSLRERYKATKSLGGSTFALSNEARREIYNAGIQNRNIIASWAYENGDEKLFDDILKSIAKGGYSAVDVENLASSLGESKDDVLQMLSLME